MIKQIAEGLQVIRNFKEALKELDHQAEKTVASIKSNGVILDKYKSKLNHKVLDVES